MNTLEDMISKALIAMSEEGKVEAIVRAHLEKAIGTAVGEAITGYKAPFNEALKNYVNNALPMDFTQIGLEGYNNTIIQVIKAKLDASLASWVEKGITEEISELLQTPLESITVSLLVEKLKKSPTYDLTRDDGDDVTVIVDESDSSDGYWRLYLDRKRYVQKHSCGFELAIDPNGKIYSIKSPYRGDITKGLFVGPLYEFDRTLFQLYAGKTKLILDEAWS